MFGSIIDILTSVDNQEIVSIGGSVTEIFQRVFCENNQYTTF